MIVIIEISEYGITPVLFKELVRLSFDNGAPVPVMPSATRASEFSIITFPARVTDTIGLLRQYNISVSRIYGADDTKLLGVSNTTWIDLCNNLPNRDAAWWLHWGLNFCIIDSDDINLYIQAHPEVQELFDAVESEITIRSIEGLKTELLDSIF